MILTPGSYDKAGHRAGEGPLVGKDTVRSLCSVPVRESQAGRKLNSYNGLGSLA